MKIATFGANHADFGQRSAQPPRDPIRRSNRANLAGLFPYESGFAISSEKAPKRFRRRRRADRVSECRRELFRIFFGKTRRVFRASGGDPIIIYDGEPGIYRRRKKKRYLGMRNKKNAKRRKKRLTEGDHARKRRHSLGRFAAFRIGS